MDEFRKVSIPPRTNFAGFTIFCGAILFGGYTLYTMSNGEGHNFGWYALHLLVPLPFVYVLSLQASCRLSACDGVLVKHDLFTTRYVPAGLIEVFTGDDGLGVRLKNGKELEFWGHGSSLIGEIFNFSTSLRTAEKLNGWLEFERPGATDDLPDAAMRVTVRADALKVLVVTVIVSLGVAVLAWMFGDVLRPLINVPAETVEGALSVTAGVLSAWT